MFFILVSTIIMVFWLQRYLSTSKTWFFQTSSSAIAFGVARFWYYVALFLAIAFVCFGIGGFWGSDPYDPAYRISTYWTFAGLASIFIGFICGFLQPNWLSPPWLRQLRREYGNENINLLIEDAIGMEKQDLEHRTASWENLESWMNEVQRKNGL